MNARASDDRPLSRRRRWLFRVLAVGLAFGLLAAVEAACRLWGWGMGDGFIDAGFDPASSLFVTNAARDRMVVREARLKFFAPDSFPVTKGETTFRIFCLGGSTVQGRPYSIETSFGSWLELSLNAGDPRRDWEVIHCGGVSYATHRLMPVLEECLHYEPDLVILCAGHNEFLEERTYAAQRNAPKRLARADQALRRLRTYNLLRAALAPVNRPAPPSAASSEVDAMLDHRGGLERYRRDEVWKAEVIARYEANLRWMVARAEAARVPMVLVLPPSNLRDTPPFKSEHAAELSPGDRARFDRLIAEARRHYGGDLARAVDALRRALALDGLYAQAHFELAEAYEALGDLPQAEQAFLRARELDVCPLRMLAPMEQRLRRVAEETGTPLLDVPVVFSGRNDGGVLGNDWLVDHVHPSIRGHQSIAERLVGLMVEQGWARLQEGWIARRDGAYKEHFNGLSALYYAKGQQRLEHLRAWTQGQVDVGSAPPQNTDWAGPGNH